jgi:hypothetical protein
LIALPNIDHYFDTKLIVCAQKIASDIRYTQYLSIAEHKSYGMEFDPADNYYRVYDVDSGNLAVDPYTRMGMELDLDESSEYVGIDLVSVNIDGANELRFTSLGEPLNRYGQDLNSIGTITLSYHGKTRTIRIFPETGWVEIQ